MVWGSGLDSAGLQYGLMVRFCEYDSKPSNNIKAGNFFINESSNSLSRKALLYENATVFVDWSVYWKQNSQ